MPTKNPRLTLTLSPSLAAQLRRMSELTGSSQASLISELLEGNERVFAQLIRVLEAAHAAKAGLASKFVAELDQAQAKIEGQLGLALDALEEPTQSLLKDVEKIRRRTVKAAGGAPLAGRASAAVGGRRAVEPPSLTGGSGTPPRKIRKARNASF